MTRLIESIEGQTAGLGMVPHLVKLCPGVRRGLFAWLTVLPVACTSSFSVAPLDNQRHPATRGVELLSSAPQRPYVLVAAFSGKEEAHCAAEVPYCSLREQAKQAGAHAIWVQKRDTVVYPGEWITINGQLTQLRPFTIERIKGVLIRYAD